MYSIRTRLILYICLVLAVCFSLRWVFSEFARVPLNSRLIEAVRNNNESEVRSLLDQGANVNCHDQEVKYGHYEMIAGEPRNGQTPLGLSVEQSGAIFDLLLERGADPNLSGSDGITPIFKAIGSENPRLSKEKWQRAEALIAHGADVNIPHTYGDGDTILIAAASRGGNIKAVKFLLAHGAKLNEKNKLGYSTLNRTIEFRNLEIMKLLLAAGADASLGDAAGETPLHHAVEEGWVEGVKTLLKLGADPNKRNNLGKTPLEWITEFHRHCYDQRISGPQVGKTDGSLRQLLQPVTGKN